jgi:hypothetical protein
MALTLYHRLIVPADANHKGTAVLPAARRR